MAGIETAAMHEATSRDDPGPGAVRRPWGWFEELAAGPSYKVKRLCVMAGQQLSLQTHAERAEHWVVVQGRGLLTLERATSRLSVGDTVTVQRGAAHRVRNEGEDLLIIVETQLGTCREDDIVRLQDDYGRAPSPAR